MLQFVAMTYRLSGDFAHNIPLRVHGTVEQLDDSPKSALVKSIVATLLNDILYRIIRVVARIQCSVPPKTAATNLVMRIPVPKTTVR